MRHDVGFRLVVSVVNSSFSELVGLDEDVLNVGVISS